MNLLIKFLNIFFISFNFKSRIIYASKKIEKNKKIIKFYQIKNKLLNLKKKDFLKQNYIKSKFDITCNIHQFIYGKIIHNEFFNNCLINAICYDKAFIYPLPTEYLNIINKFQRVNYRISLFVYLLTIITLLIYNFFVIIFSIRFFLKRKNKFSNFIYIDHLPISNFEQSRSLNNDYINFLSQKYNFILNKKTAILYGNKKFKMFSQNNYIKYNTIYCKNIFNFIFNFSEIKIYFFSFKKIFKFLFYIFKFKKFHLIFLIKNYFYYFLYNKKKNNIPEKVFFDNNSISFRPLWTYAQEEKKQKSTIFVFYSTNNIPLGHKKLKIKYYENSAIPLLNWPNYLLWKNEQLKWLKKILLINNFKYKEVSFLPFEGNNIKINVKKKRKILTIFDIAPKKEYQFRTLVNHYNFYSLDYVIKFLSDIISASKETRLELIIKTKRASLLLAHQEYIDFVKKNENVNFSVFTGEVSASSLISQSNASICMPFTSAALISFALRKKTIFYDPSKKLNNKYSMNKKIKIINNYKRLKSWIKKI